MSDLWPQEGSYLGHYRLVQKLDEGGMGAVYKAHEAALDRFVAVKVLSPEMAKDAEFVHSFLREARAVAAMNHPNIIQIYFIGQHDDYIYFAMELIEGHALDRLARQAHKPEPKEWLGYMRQAAVGLQYAHNHGVIHRDIKPANLILNELGLVKVADFGLARKTGAGAESSLAVADSMGTPEYMSPEEAAGEDVDHRSDIYSLGATLYHLLAGRPPFSGASGTEIMMHQIHTPLPQLRKLNPGVPQPICGIVEKCMAKLPGERYQSYEQLIHAVDEVLKGRAPATRVAVPHTMGAAPSHPPPRQRGGPGAMTWLLLVAILGAAGFGIWKISETQKKNRPQPLPPEKGQPEVKPLPEPAGKPEPRTVPAPVPRPQPKPEVAQPAPVPRGPWQPFVLTDTFNWNVLSRAAQAQNVSGFEPPSVQWLTEAAVKEAGLANMRGLPDNGVIGIPGATPPGSFHLNLERGADVILLHGEGGKFAQPLFVRIPPAMRQRYEKLAILHACAHGNATLVVRLNYVGGVEEKALVDLRDYNPMAAKPATNSPVALSIHARGSPHVTDFHSQIIEVSPRLPLRGIQLSLENIETTGGVPASKFTAGVFAISAVRSTNTALWTVLPPAADTNHPAGEAARPKPPAVEYASFKDVAEPIARLMATLQFEAAEAEVVKLDATATDAQKPIFAALEKDASRLVAFKRRTADGIAERAGRAVSIVLRTGARIDSQLGSADMSEITLRKPLPGGFAESQYRWVDISPASLLPIFAATVDIKSAGEVYDYGLLLFYQALYQQVRAEDVKRALATAAAGDATLKADADSHLKWLDEWLGSPSPVEVAAPTPATGARVERGIVIAAGPQRWNWQCFDLAAACNADVIFTESRAAPDEFAAGTGMGWTTAGWLTRNNIAGDFNGIPDDGRVMLADNDPRLCFSIAMPPRRNVILLSGESGRQPKPVRLDLPAELRVPYRQISLLHASAWGDAAVNVDLVYADGSIQTRHIQTLDWQPGSKMRSHDLTPDQFTAIATRGNKITVMSRYEMVAEIISANEERRLAAIILSFDASRGTRGVPADPRTTAGIFAISAMPGR